MVIFFVGLNLIDYAIVALFALSVLVGLHRGTVATGLNLLALGLSLEDAVRVGHAAAALSVTAFGAQGGMPRMEQLLPLLSEVWKEKLGL